MTDSFNEYRNPDGTRMQEYPTDIEIRMHKAGKTCWHQPIYNGRYKEDRRAQANIRRGAFHARKRSKD